MVNLTVIGLTLQGEEGAPMLLLHPRGTDSILSLPVGPMEAFAVASALHGGGHAEAAGKTPGAGGPAQPPLAYDFFLECIMALDGKLTAVDVTRMERGVFHARATLLGKRGQVRVPCRPADGIALALRCGAALRADPSVLVQARPLAAVLAALPAHIRMLAEAALEKERSTPDAGNRVQVAVSPPAAPGGTVQVGQPAKRPVIHVSLVRQDAGGKNVVEELRLVPSGASAPTKPETRLNGDTAEDDRWFALLQSLSPETKVPM